MRNKALKLRAMQREHAEKNKQAETTGRECQVHNDRAPLHQPLIGTSRITKLPMTKATEHMHQVSTESIESGKYSGVSESIIGLLAHCVCVGAQLEWQGDTLVGIPKESIGTSLQERIRVNTPALMAIRNNEQFGRVQVPNIPTRAQRLIDQAKCDAIWMDTLGSEIGKTGLV